MPRRWLITGCSDGLGREIALAALTMGNEVVATARNVDALDALDGATPALTKLQLDVTSADQIARAVAAAGRVDVLVNNAGHGYIATVEEGEEDKIRRTFDVNFFGPAALTRAVLPMMRAQGAGTVVNISSVAGFNAGAGSAYYSAAKYALEGLSDALIAEAGPLGVRVLIVEPGPIRTSFAGRSILRSPSLPAYAETARTRQHWILESDGTQSGDPAAIARLLVELVSEDAPIERAILGKMAVRGVSRKLDQVARDRDWLHDRGMATDFPT